MWEINSIISCSLTRHILILPVALLEKKNTHLKISNFYSEIYYTMLDFRGQILSVWHFWLMMTKYASQVYGGYKTLTQCHTGPSSWMTLSYYSGFLWGLRPSTSLSLAGKKLQDGFFDCPDYLTLGLIGSLLVQMFNVQNSF